MKPLEIKKNIKIWFCFLRFSFISATVYKTSFFVELFVEIAYCFWFLFSVQITYANVKEVAGWNRLEMIFLAGLCIVFSEIFTGLFFVWGLRAIPEKIKDGKIDFALLKPVNCLFNLSTGQPYITSFLATIPGLYLMYYAASGLNIAWNWLNILIAVLFLLCGLIILYSISVMLVSLSFIFLNARFLPEIGQKFVDYAANPHQAYNLLGLKIIFFIFLPVVFMISFPSATIIKTVNPLYLIMAVSLAILFFISAITVWNTLIKKYVSASS